MAKLPAILCLGQSNMHGLAPLSEVAAADFVRWFGESGKPANFLNFSKKIHGINMWTHRLPCGSYTSVTASGGGHTTTVVNTAGLVDSAHKNKWVVCTGGGNVGTVRFISANTTTSFTVDAAWGVLPVDTDTFEISSAGSQGADTDFATAANPNFSYEGKFLPLQFEYQTATTWTYTTGYEWPNFIGTPPATPGRAVNFFSDNQGIMSPIVEITWQMRHHFGDDLWVISCPIPYSFLSVQKGALAVMTVQDFSWFRSLRMNDWNPSSTEYHGALGQTVNACFYDLYGFLIDFLLKSQVQTWLAANRPGDEIDIQGIFIALGESETTDTSGVRQARAGRNMEILRDSMRAAIGAGAGTKKLTSLTPSRIPWIMHGIETAGYPTGSVVNPLYQQLAADDEFTGFVDVDDLATRGSDPLHFTGQSYVTIGQRSADKWREIKLRESDASPVGTRRATLAEIRSQVRLRYQANDVSNAGQDILINRAINDAARRIINRLGHTASFLKRTETISISATSTTSFTMPAIVGHVLSIRDPNDPKREFRFSKVGQTSNGRVQIVMEDFWGVTQNYLVDFIRSPRDMLGDNDICLIPYEHIELIVVLAVLQLEERGGNALRYSNLQAQAAELWASLWRQEQAGERSRNSRWHTEPEGFSGRAMLRDGPMYGWF